MGNHYVPRKYLEGFAIPPERKLIWMYDKKRNTWTKASLSRVAQERGYFSAQTERELAELVENPAHSALHQLRNGVLPRPEARAALILYIGVMIMRVPRLRRVAYELIPKALEETVAEIRARFERAYQESGAAAIRNQLEKLPSIHERYKKQPPDNLVEQIHAPWPSEVVLAALASMTWRFVYAAPPSFFLTSDNPAFFFESLGLGTGNAELTFPLASDLALFADRQGPPATTMRLRGPAPRDVVKEANRRLASGAERFVFYHQPAPWIATLAQRRNPYLSLIRW